jgi:hypothetical protein
VREEMFEMRREIIKRRGNFGICVSFNPPGNMYQL